MFAKNKVPQSLIDAVKQVTENKIESQPEMLNEAGWEKVPTPTGTKVYGSSYGDSKKARKDQTKSSVDDVKEPKKKDIESQKEETGYFTQKLLEREMTGAESRKKERIVMRMKDKQDYFKKKYGKRWKEVMYATATKQAMGEELNYVEEEESGLRMAAHAAARSGKKMFSFQGKTYPVKVTKEEVELDEKNESHTHAAHYENDKGEWTGMNLFAAKDDEDAIKQAHAKCKEGCRLSRVERHIPVKEEVEQIDEIKSLERYSKKMDVDLDHLKAAHKIDMEKTDRDTAHKMMKKSLGSKYNKDHANWSINAFREEVELDESEPAYKDKPDHKPMSDVVNRKKTVGQIMKGSKYFGSGKMKEDGDCVTKPQAKDIAKKEIKGHEKKMHKEEALNEITTISHEPSADKDTAVDMLRGRVQGDGKANSFLSYKRKLEGDGIKNPEPEQIAKDSTPARKSIDAKGGGIDPVEIKQDSRYGARKEEYDLDEAKQPETDNVPFAKPYNTTSSPVVTDKSGAKHTPMSRARDLARQALKRMKKENMLGKAPGNN